MSTKPLNRRELLDCLNVTCKENDIDKKHLFITNANAEVLNGNREVTTEVIVTITSELWPIFLILHSAKGHLSSNSQLTIGSVCFREQLFEIKYWEEVEGYRVATEYQVMLNYILGGSIEDAMFVSICGAVVAKLMNFPADGCALMRWLTPRQGVAVVSIKGLEDACNRSDLHELALLVSKEYPEYGKSSFFSAHCISN